MALVPRLRIRNYGPQVRGATGGASEIFEYGAQISRCTLGSPSITVRPVLDPNIPGLSGMVATKPAKHHNIQRFRAPRATENRAWRE